MISDYATANSVEDALLADVGANLPRARQVLADWLDDQGRHAEAGAWRSDREPLESSATDGPFWWWTQLYGTDHPANGLSERNFASLEGGTLSMGKTFRYYPARLDALKALADACRRVEG